MVRSYTETQIYIYIGHLRTVLGAHALTFPLMSVLASDTKSRDAISRWNARPQLFTHASNNCNINTNGYQMLLLHTEMQ